MKTTRNRLSLLPEHLSMAGGVLFWLGVFAISGAEDASEFRQFTDQNGQTMEARVLAGTAETATVQMANGKTYTLPITRFSRGDQAFIRGWVRANPTQTRYTFEVAETAKRVARERRESASYKVMEESWVYLLKVRNRSGFDVDNLDLRYRVFYSLPNTSDAGGSPKVKTVEGIALIAAIRNSAEAEVTTDPVTLLESRLTTGSEFTDGSDIEKKEELDGVWVKLFHGGVKAGEFKLGSRIVKEAEWSDQDALAIEADVDDPER